ncbi:cytochrome c biogenesis protein/redoxin [Intestinimonas massiliensis (ex Afouda et al. 2020)]|uniref:cytochrome c biogenesis protein/redoxin n=1 Tax=Intestinimonas massiliensis (ex Afouda et al. 2020) TaxID=1673721 RepID=UPI00102F60FB|nr:cytochrome c biogenesis protein/redoxin [Intestinimonas massiliensis (ex Afouda et al. 2020)]
MGFDLETSVPAVTVFIQGLLSFFSPCVLPLVPLYVSYLAGGAGTVDGNGVIRYPRGRVLINTLFFVIGVSFTFFLLGFGFTALGRFFHDYQTWFTRISGIIMILFGIYQFGFFGKSAALEREHRLPFRLDRWAMNPLVALILGFTFSFAWTPCVGPTLSSVLLMASSASSASKGFLLIGVYTAGFVIPFLAVGLFTGTVLGFFKRHQRVVRYTVKVGAALLILMGVMTLTGFMNGITGYLSGVTGDTTSQQTETAEPEASPEESQRPVVAAPDFTLTDQYGNTHTLSDYKGKTVFLNFWATWCGPCKREMPDIQALYESHGENEGDVIVLGVAGPKTEQNPFTNEGSQEDVEQFLEDNGYTFPVVMDLTGEIQSAYAISAFPTTFMIDSNGNVYGYVPGALTGDIMESIIQQTIDSVS